MDIDFSEHTWNCVFNAWKNQIFIDGVVFTSFGDTITNSKRCFNSIFVNTAWRELGTHITPIFIFHYVLHRRRLTFLSLRSGGQVNCLAHVRCLWSCSFCVIQTTVFTRVCLAAILRVSHYIRAGCFNVFNMVAVIAVWPNRMPVSRKTNPSPWNTSV